MHVINLFGAPGAGKSSGAAYVFSKLKAENVNAELATEWVKDKVYEENKTVFHNQAYIFGQQYFKLSRLENKVDVVVTDSPLFMSILYNKHEPPLDYTQFDEFVYKVFRYYDNFNYFVTRTKPYNPSGRIHTETESNELSVKLKDLLHQYCIPYTEIQGNFKGYDKIVEDYMKMYNK